MALTYVNIQTITLGSSQTNVTFSSIPQTYTDLAVRASARTDQTNPDLMWRINNNTGSIYSDNQMYSLWDGTAWLALHTRDSAIDKYRIQYIGQESDSTTNTFGNYEWYFPSYTAAINKPVYFFGVDESNTATSNQPVIAQGASLGQTTTAISEISFFLNAGNWVSGTTFYLYGIKQF